MGKSPDEVSAIVAVVAAAISVVALLVNIISTIITTSAGRRAIQAAERNNEIFLGQIENELRAQISKERKRYEDICATLEAIVQGRRPDQLNAQEKRSLATLRRRQQSVVEDLLNAYENAASKYIDDKIDRVRFKKSYHGEFRKLFEKPESSFGKILHPEGTSGYRALWKVYREWYDLENQESIKPKE